VIQEFARPLQVVSGYIEMIMFEGELKDSSLQYLQEIRKQALRLMDITAGLHNLRTIRTKEYLELDRVRGLKTLHLKDLKNRS
jgi:hypothetical protein